MGGEMAASDDDSASQTYKDDKKEKRTSRACLVCRKRKSACHLPVVDGVPTTPCERCKANNLECVIGSSNRGGRRVRKRTLDQANLDEDAGARPPPHTPGTFDATGVDFSSAGAPTELSHGFGMGAQGMN